MFYNNLKFYGYHFFNFHNNLSCVHIVAAHQFAESFKQNNKLSQKFWKQMPLFTQSNICASLFLAERKDQAQFSLYHNPLPRPAVCLPFRYSFYVSTSCLSQLFGLCYLAQYKDLYKVSVKLPYAVCVCRMTVLNKRQKAKQRCMCFERALFSRIIQLLN